MSANLEDAVIIIEDALKIRRSELANQDPEAAYDTEESVMEALRRNGASPLEVLHLRDRYTRTVRLILREVVDPKG